ncbi:hypothetical protein BDN72DRAFT_898129 [Pluteus cervinus]|uniref:Uncharacterized protein n=1 Tax=Pluteus cervinus TaxID=181527 RepID=A0ACD3ASA9_9AGAR|nr:hypothetical protein BDN72DRAFT_898129 [Pluteus cervinus]
MSMAPDLRLPASDGVPTDESPSQLLGDTANLVSLATSGAAWGIMVTLYAICLYYLFQHMSPRNRTCTIFQVVLASFTTALGTISIVLNIKHDVQSYVLHRLYPGGPLAYEVVMSGDSPHLVANICWIVLNVIVGGLVTWRSFILWRGRWVVGVLAILNLACICTGLFAVIQGGIHHTNVFGPVVAKFSLLYMSLALTTTVLGTILVVARTLYQRYNSQETLVRGFTSIASMLIESAALNSVFTILCIQLYVVESPFFSLFFDIAVQVQIIASLLIILQTSRGEAKARESNPPSEIVISGLKRQSSYHNPSTNGLAIHVALKVEKEEY